MSIVKWGSRGCRYLAFMGLSLLLLLALVVFVIGYTPSGLQLVRWSANKWLPQLHIDQVEGALLTKVTLQGVRWHDPKQGVDLHAHQLSLAIQASCLLRAEVCIHSVALEGVQLHMVKVTRSTPDTVSSASSPVTFPVPVRIDELSLANISLSVFGNQIDLKHLHSAGLLQGRQIDLAPTKVQGLSITLPHSSQEAASTQSSSSKKHQQPLALPEIELPVAINLKRLEMDQLAVHQANTHWQVEKLVLVGRAAGHKINVQQLSVVMPQFTGDLHGHVLLANDYPLAISADINWQQNPFSGQNAQLFLSGSLAKLQLKSHWQGPLTANLTASVNTLQPNLPFDIHISDVLSQWPLQGQHEYQLAISRLTARGDLAGYRLNMAGKVSGKQVPPSQFSLQGTGSRSQLSLGKVQLSSLAGEVTGKASINWQSLLRWQSHLQLQHLNFSEQWPEWASDISGQIQTKGSLTSQGGWQLEVPKLALNGTLRQQAFALFGSVKASDQTGGGHYLVTTPQLRLEQGKNSLSLKGELGRHWNMIVRLNAQDLAISLPDAQGSLVGTVRVTEPLATPKVSVNLLAKSLAWNQSVAINQIATKQVAIKQLQLQGVVSPMSDDSTNLTLRAQQIHYQQRVIRQLDAKLSGTLTEQQLTMSVKADKLSGALKLTGGYQATPAPIWHGQLMQMSLKSALGTWRLDSQPKIDVSPKLKQVTVSAHCWRNGQSSLCLDKKANIGPKGQVHLSVHQLDLHQLAVLTPPDVDFSGLAEASLDVAWGAKPSPSLALHVAMPKGEIIQSQLGSPQQKKPPLVMGWNKIEFDATVDNNTLTANWAADLASNGDLKGNIVIGDLDSNNKVLGGVVQAKNLNITPLKPLLGAYSDVKAEINADVRLQGDLQNPQLFGRFTADKIAVTGDISPVDVQSGNVRIDFLGRQSRVLGEITTEDGKLNLSGGAKWQSLSSWSAQAKVNSTGLQVDVPPMAKLKVVPDLTMSVTPTLAKITGNIAIPSGAITVDKLPPNAVKVSKDQVILSDSRGVQSARKSSAMKIESNVKISIGDKVALSAFGLNSDLSGELDVTQNEKGPFIVGTVNLLNGSYRSFGQDLTITKGKILFSGPVDKPYVEITAIRNPDNTQDSVTAGIKVTGPSDEPVVTVFSDPSMPQANALSYLLRGQNLDTQTGDSAMATTLIGMSLAKSGHLVGQLGQAVGVQDLQLNTTGSGDSSQVMVSGYVLPHLQVKYGVGIFDQVGEFTVRYQLISNLYLEAVSGLDSAVDVLYQFEFD